ncbi:MAG TPA: hypothetical protein VH933_16800 [Aestuariivirgaceae bacterium]|jgi:hypothetical protein
MRKLSYLFAIAAISGLTSFATASSASPLASGLAGANTATPTVSDDLVQKVHGWHCRRKFGWYRGDKYWHRHRRACGYSYYDDRPFIGFYPFFGLSFDRDRHRHRHHFKHHKRWKDWD